MGAWGLGFFESDHDADMMMEFEEEAGLRQLEVEAKQRAKADEAVKRAYSCQADPMFKHESDRVYLAIQASHCSSDGTVALVRDHLNNGVLARMIATLEAANPKHGLDFKGYSYQGYKYVLLGACAMTLGCTLPPSFKAGLKAKYESVGLMRDALKEMKKALYGPKGFVDGVPYVMEVPEGERVGDDVSDQLFPGSMLLNVQAPGNPLQTPDAMKAMGEIMEKLKRETGWGMGGGEGGGKPAAPKEYGADVCGGCGAGDGGKGGTLSACAKCKKQRYCSTECQKKHWKQHKGACKVTAEN